MKLWGWRVRSEFGCIYMQIESWIYTDEEYIFNGSGFLNDSDNNKCYRYTIII